MCRVIFAVLLVSCGVEPGAVYVGTVGGGKMSAKPPDDWRMAGGDFGVWGTDADLVEDVSGAITAFSSSDAGTTTTVTSEGHNVQSNMPVRAYGTTNYDGWHVATYVDADNFKINTAFVADDATGTWLTSWSGDAWILFEDTTPVSDPAFFLDLDKLVEVEEGQPWLFDAVVCADSIAGGDTVVLLARWYDQDKVYDSGTAVVAATVLASVGTWYYLSGVAEVPAGIRFATPQFNKANNAFHVGLDKLGMRPMPVAAAVNLSGAQGVNTTTQTKLQFNTEVYDYGSNFDITNYRFTAPATGLYNASLYLHWTFGSAPTSPCLFWGQLFKNGVLDRYVIFQNDADAILYLGSRLWTGSWSDTLLLSNGDYLEGYFYHTNAAGTGVINVQAISQFSVSRVE